jgi:hypothetical protein
MRVGEIPNAEASWAIDTAWIHQSGNISPFLETLFKTNTYRA